MLLEQLLNPGLTRATPAGSGTEEGRASHPVLPTFLVFSFWEGDLVGPARSQGVILSRFRVWVLGT